MVETYYEKNKERLKEKARLWKKNNRDKYLSSEKNYRDKNKEKRRAYEKERQKKPEVKAKIRKNVLNHYYRNREKQLLKMKKFREENKQWFINYRRNNLERLKNYQKLYQNKNKNNIILHRLRTRLRIAVNKYSCTGKIMFSKKYPIDYAAIIEHLKPFPDDLSKYHIDHIRPLSSFDFNSIEEIKKAFAPENHQWLLEFDNLSKNNRII